MDTNQLYYGERIPEAGDHQTLAIGGVSAATAATIPPGLYTLEPTSGCHFALGAAPVADATYAWIRGGGGVYQVVKVAMKVAVIWDVDATAGVLHITRRG